MDIIKRTILKQDLIFRKQVHELHRLYQVQKLLSKDYESKVPDQEVFNRSFDLRLSADEFIINGSESNHFGNPTAPVQFLDEAKRGDLDLNEPFIDDSSNQFGREISVVSRDSCQFVESGEHVSFCGSQSESLQRAAESLIHLSTARSRIMEDNPEASGDSYENIVLKLGDDSLDDEAVSSAAVKCDAAGGVGNGCKLRRGRRLKDFQKEILPSIVCLAVQEIRDDIGVMEGVLKSREYRKLRPKLPVHEHNWCLVKQRRRSRLQHVRRRIFT